MPPCSTLTNTFQGDKSGLSSLLSPSFKVWQRHVRNLFNTPKITYLVSILCNSTTSSWLKSWTITKKRRSECQMLHFIFIMVRYLETENWVKNHFLACNNNLHKPTEQWIHWCRAQRVEPVTSQALLQKPLLTILRPCSLLAIPHWMEMLTPREKLPIAPERQRTHLPLKLMLTVPFGLPLEHSKEANERKGGECRLADGGNTRGINKMV